MASGRYARKSLPEEPLELEKRIPNKASRISYDSVYTSPTSNTLRYPEYRSTHLVRPSVLRRYIIELEPESNIRKRIKDTVLQSILFIPYLVGSIVIAYYLIIGLLISIQWLILFIGQFWPYIQSSEVIPPLANIAGIVQGLAIIIGGVLSIFKFLNKKK